MLVGAAEDLFYNAQEFVVVFVKKNRLGMVGIYSSRRGRFALGDFTTDLFDLPGKV